VKLNPELCHELEVPDMPMLDAYIPEGALPAEAEIALLVTLTDVLLEHEGADPRNPAARALAKVWLHRPATVLHAGDQPAAPHYRVIASVPEGQFDDERRASMVAAVTEGSWMLRAGATTATRCVSGCSPTRFPTAPGAAADASPGWPTLQGS
jgi:hypothetical protein